MARPPLILVVDDNTWMQRIVAKIIASYGWEPLTAGSGYDAIALAINHTPDLIILDLVMPELSGMHVLQLLKRIDQTADIPVLILSVATDVELLMEAMRRGAAGFIRKPFTRSTIYEKVAEVLGPILFPPTTSETPESHPSHPDTASPPPPVTPPLERYRQSSATIDDQDLRRWLDSI